MNAKNIRKSIFKYVAENATDAYERVSEDTFRCGDFIVTVCGGYYAAWRNWTPVSFHCEHNRGYAHEIWEGESYNIERREVDDGLERILFDALWNLPHLGHYILDPEDARHA